MKQHNKSLALWVSSILALLGMAVALHCATGCGGGQEPALVKTANDVAACEEELARRVLEAANCNEAQFKVDAVLATVPTCKGYGHFEVCTLFKHEVDGGTDGHDR